jgi:hypothetical protein
VPADPHLPLHERGAELDELPGDVTSATFDVYGTQGGSASASPAAGAVGGRRIGKRRCRGDWGEVAPKSGSAQDVHSQHGEGFCTPKTILLL